MKNQKLNVQSTLMIDEGETKEPTNGSVVDINSNTSNSYDEATFQNVDGGTGTKETALTKKIKTIS